MLGEQLQTELPAEITPWPELDPTEGQVAADNSIPTVLDILEEDGIRDQNKEFLDFIFAQRGAERELEELILEKREQQLYPDPDLIAEPELPKTKFQAERLLLNSLGLLQTGHLAEMDSNREG